jgi:hypothetical protein
MMARPSLSKKVIESRSGPDHAPIFTVVMTIEDAQGHYDGLWSEGTGSSLKEAEHDAARKLHPLLGHRDTDLELVDAWCGDRANGLLVGLLGRALSLSAEDLNNVEEELFSNKAMHAATEEDRRLVSARTTGTRFEADVGAALQVRPLIELLQAAMPPQDLARLHDALRRAAAKKSESASTLCRPGLVSSART